MMKTSADTMVTTVATGEAGEAGEAGATLTNVNPGLPVFINKQSIDEPQFAAHIQMLARSDAVHDIKKTIKWFETKSFTNLFNQSILENTTPDNNNHPNEDVCFMSVINSVLLRQAFLDIFVIDDEKREPFQVGYKMGDNFTHLHTYSCIPISVKKTTGNLVDPNLNFAQNFIDKTGLNMFALIVDFNTHEFLESFKNGTQVVGEIFYALTPEVINDPAPKTSMQNTIFNRSEKGFKMTPIYQTDNEPTFYSRYSATNNAYNNNFMSAYDFKLSKLTRVITKKVESFTTDLTITTLNNDQPYSSYIVNGKHENSNKTVTSFLSSLFNTILKPNATFQNKFDIATKYQQKRLGDWGQVLACLDLNNRNFNKYIPATTAATAVAEATSVATSVATSTAVASTVDIKTIPKFIVTHDKICVTYALLMGENIIYLDYYGIAYIFMNQADTAIASIPYPQLLYNTLLNEFYKTGGVIPGNSYISKILGFNGAYNVGRSTNFQEKYYVILEKLTEIKLGINLIDNEITEDIVTTTIQLLKELFCLCVELKYMEMYLINTTKDIELFNFNEKDMYGLNSYKNENLYNHEHNDKYVELYSSFNRLNGVFTQHNGGEYDPHIDMYNNIITDGWLNIVKKLDVYKSAFNLFEDESTSQKTTKYDIRLLNYNNGDEKRINDSFMFLPYIQHIDAGIRNDIIQLFDVGIVPNIVIPLYSKLLTKSSFVAGAMRVFRNGAQASDQKQFNQLVDLVYQVRVFLTPSPEELRQDIALRDNSPVEPRKTVETRETRKKTGKEQKKKTVEPVETEKKTVEPVETEKKAGEEEATDLKSNYKSIFKICIQKVINQNKQKNPIEQSGDWEDVPKDTSSQYPDNIDWSDSINWDDDELWAGILSVIEDSYGINNSEIETEIDIKYRSTTTDEAIVTADFGGIMLLNTDMLSNKTKHDKSAIKSDDDVNIDDIYEPTTNYHSIKFGGHRFYAKGRGGEENTLATRRASYNTANTICDMSIKQTTYPLFINSLFKKYNTQLTLTSISSSSAYISTLTPNGQLINYDLKVAPYDSPILELPETLKNATVTDRPIERQPQKHNRPTGSQLVAAAEADTDSCTGSSCIQPQLAEKLSFAPSVALRDIYGYPSTHRGGAPSPQFSILENHALGFHPLLPLYMVLQPFYFVITDSLTKSCFYNENLKYIKIIEKMCTELIKVIDTDQKDALMIGFGLRTFIFTATRINNNEPLTSARHLKMLEIIDMSESEYRTICNKWDIFVNTYGIIRETRAEIIERNQYLESPIFREFITNKVNIKQIIGTEIAEFPTETELNTNVIQLLKIIADKIWSDRNPHWIEPVQPVKNINPIVIPLQQPQQPKHKKNTKKKPKKTKKTNTLIPNNPQNKKKNTRRPNNAHNRKTRRILVNEFQPIL